MRLGNYFRFTIGVTVITRFRIAYLLSLTAMLPGLALQPLHAAQEPITPIPLTIKVDRDMARLGEKLFHDVRLSHDDSISCAHCHVLPIGGADNQPRSSGMGGRMGTINTPTVFNSSLNFVQFWDGRARTLEHQIDGPVTNPVELGTNWGEVVAKLRQDPEMMRLFTRSYKEGITADTIKESIASFERTLLTPNSRFDDYLRGNPNAITAREQKGYQLFKSYGCISCHQGVAVGGNMYEKMGIVHDYFYERGNVTEADYGRFNVTKDEEDRFEFKVPSLRLVALTPPYFHDGSAATLEDAVKTMARYQLGRPIPDGDIGLIVEFMKSLSGDLGAYKDILNAK